MAVGSVQVSADAFTDGNATWGSEVTITAPYQLGSNVTAEVDFKNGKTVVISGVSEFEFRILKFNQVYLHFSSSPENSRDSSSGSEGTSGLEGRLSGP